MSDHGHDLARYSVGVGLEHRVIPGLGGYLEVFGATSRAYAHTGEWNEWIAGTGFTRRLGGRVELDVQAGYGLSPEAPDWLGGFGITIRGGGR